MSDKTLTVADLIKELLKLPSEMEIWNLSVSDQYPADGESLSNNYLTSGLIVWEGKLWLTYDSAIEDENEVTFLFKESI